MNIKNIRKIIFLLIIVLVLLLIQAQFAFRISIYAAAIASYYLFFIASLLLTLVNKINRKDVLVWIPLISIFYFTVVTYFVDVFFYEFAKKDIKEYLMPHGLFQELFAIFGSITTYLITNNEHKIKKKWIFIPLLFTIFLSTGFSSILDKWLFYRNYGKWTFREEKPEPNWTATDKNGNTITDTIFDDKILIFDFWNEYCGACYKAFPKVATVKNKFTNNENIKFVAFNIPSQKSSPDFDPFIVQEKYGIEVWNGTPNLEQEFNILLYPTVIVIKQNKIVYIGDIEQLEEYLWDFLKK